MFKFAKPFFIKVLTPLHAGSGQDLGIVDMPIQRERHTGFPKIEGSGLKGSIREVFEKSHEEINVGAKKVDNSNREKIISLAFGPNPNEGSGNEHAGAISFTDARLLLFPVKSAKGVFAWIICEKVLSRFVKDMEIAKQNQNFGKLQDIDDGSCIVTKLSNVTINNSVILEEYSFSVKNNEGIDKIAKDIGQYTGISDLENKLVILSNNDFKDFVNLSTEVITRTRISPETGTVQKGALFTEEYLPSETVLYSLALTTPIFVKEKNEKEIFIQDGKKEEELVMEFLKNGIPEIMQIGGNATIGKGIVEIKMMEDNNEQ